MTQIDLLLADQLLTVVQQPTVASGDQNSVRIQVEFDSRWTDYTKSAVFLTASDPTVYEVALTSNTCIVPWEVLTTDGILYIGVRGVNIDQNKVKTSTLVSYKIVKGAPGGTGTTVDPTTDAYAQIIARLEALEKGGNSGGGGISQEEDPTVPEWAKQPNKPSYTAEEVGADPKGTASLTMGGHNADRYAHDDIRQKVQNNADQIAVLNLNKLDTAALPAAIDAALEQAQPSLVEAVIAALPKWSGGAY